MTSQTYELVRGYLDLARPHIVFRERGKSMPFTVATDREKEHDWIQQHQLVPYKYECVFVTTNNRPLERYV